MFRDDLQGRSGWLHGHLTGCPWDWIYAPEFCITPPMHITPRALIPLFVLISAAVIAVDWAAFSGREGLTREGGSVETLSCIGYLVAAVLYLIHAGNRIFWPVPTILLFMALREFDADKRFTSEGVLSTKIFIRDTALWEKGLAAVVWVVLLWAIYALIRHRTGPFLRALRAGRAWALSLSAGIFIAAFSKSIDGLGRKLAPMGVDISSEVSTNAAYLEEGLEFFIPVLFMLAIVLKPKPQAA